MKIAILGAGNMACAIVGAAARAGKMPMDTFCAYDKFPSQLERISVYGINVTDSLENALDDADFVLLSVKPQDLASLIDEIKSICYEYKNKKYITICAGVSTSYLCELLGECVPVIRVMPNAPMSVGAGATAITRNKLVNDKDYSKMCGIFSFGGVVASIPEDQMNAVISVNSSSPAYFYEFARIMIEYATSCGIDAKTARILTQNAMLGAAKTMCASPEKTPEDLIATVKSKKGTTEAALLCFEKNGFKRIITEAMQECTKRAIELGK